MTRSGTASPTSRYDWVASLAFWICLFVAAGLFASVTLAPRLAAYIDLQAEYQANQVELVRMESRAQYLEKVVEALATDPHFAAEVARIDFDAVRPGDERIAVDKSLSLNAPRYDPPEITAPPSPPWYAPVARFLSSNPALRPLTLLVAAGLIVVAFTFLHDSADERPPAAEPRRRRTAA